MPGFKHILVALDGKPSSELALEAAERAAGESARLTLVQVAEDLVANHHLPEGCDKEAFWEKQVEPVRRYLRETSRSISRPDLSVDIIVASGHPADAILDIAQELEVDAVSMCSHSHSPLRRFLLGSTVESVMARLRVPLVIAHPAESPRDDGMFEVS